MRSLKPYHRLNSLEASQDFGRDRERSDQTSATSLIITDQTGHRYIHGLQFVAYFLARSSSVAVGSEK